MSAAGGAATDEPEGKIVEVKIGILGAAGRMGQALVRTITASEGCSLVGGVDRKESEAIGRDLGEIAGIGPVGLALGTDPRALIAAADAVIDFTIPSACITHAALVAAGDCAYVVGTTGLVAPHIAALNEAAKNTAVVQSPNMSLGVNLLLALTERTAATLGDDFDIEILEMHHRRKVDAPSGTALALGEAAARGRKRELAAISQRGRDGMTGPRRSGDIGFAVLRGGNVVGDHTVIFAADDERIELTHRAADRAIFARGAVKAALWAQGRKPGLYAMADVLGFAPPGS